MLINITADGDDDQPPVVADAELDGDVWVLTDARALEPGWRVFVAGVSYKVVNDPDGVTRLIPWEPSLDELTFLMGQLRTGVEPEGHPDRGRGEGRPQP